MRSIVMLLKKCALVNLSAALLLASTYVGPVVSQAQAATGCFAVYCQDDQSLRFYKRTSVPRAGSVFDGRSVAAVYTGFESAGYVRTRLSSKDHAAPWAEYANQIKTVTVVDYGISPKNISNWFAGADKSSGWKYKHMFTKCTSIDLGKLDTSKTTLMRNVFWGCSALTSLVLPRTGTPAATDMSFMFWGCSSLRSVDLTKFNASHVTGHGLMDLFSGCSSLEQVKLPSSLHTGHVTNMGFMFSGCKSLRSINLRALNTRNVQVMNFMFYGCSSLSSIDLKGFSTASATNMAYMFANCSGLKSIDVSKFNTSHVTEFGAMFEGCTNLRSLNLSNFNTTKATNTIRMFKGCSSLKSLSLKSFRTPNLSMVSGMFQGCSSLTSVDISRFDTDRVYDFKNMFRGCSSLKKLDISSMVTRKITMAGYVYRPDMRNMFAGCTALSLVVNTAEFDVANKVGKNFSFPPRMNAASWKKGRISVAEAALSMSSAQRLAALSAHAIGGTSNVLLNTKIVNSQSVDKTTKKLGTTAKKVNSVTLGSKVKTVETKSLRKCSKAKTVTVVSKKFTKKSIKGSLKSSHVKKVIICVGGKKKNKAYAKKYKKYLSKKNIGKKVKVVAA